MTIKRKNRTLRHLVVFALERYFLETTKNPQGLKGFRAQLFRMKLSLDYDRKLDRKAGADAAYFRSVSQAWGMIKDMKKPLVKEGSFFEKDADGAFYFAKSEA